MATGPPEIPRSSSPAGTTSICPPATTHMLASPTTTWPVFIFSSPSSSTVSAFAECGSLPLAWLSVCSVRGAVASSAACPDSGSCSPTSGPSLSPGVSPFSLARRRPLLRVALICISCSSFLCTFLPLLLPLLSRPLLPGSTVSLFFTFTSSTAPSAHSVFPPALPVVLPLPLLPPPPTIPSPTTPSPSPSPFSSVRAPADPPCMVSASFSRGDLSSILAAKL